MWLTRGYTTGISQIAPTPQHTHTHTHTHQDKQFLNIPSAIISDKLRNIVIIPCSIMTIHFSYFRELYVTVKGFSLSIVMSVFHFPGNSRFKQVSSLPRQKRNICWSFGLLVTSTICSLFVHQGRICTLKFDVLENILLKSLSKLNDPLMPMRCC